jgi:hypothetical protein
MGGCSLLAAPYHNFAYSAEARVPLTQMEPMPLDERKIIARRASFGEIAARGPGVRICLPLSFSRALPRFSGSAKAVGFGSGLAIGEAVQNRFA